MRATVAAVDVLTGSAYGRLMLNWSWTKWPPLMQRTLADDLRWALCVLAGVTLGYVVFGDGDTSLLVGAGIGAALVIVLLQVLRRVRRGPSA
jgi:hypothetical protein